MVCAMNRLKAYKLRIYPTKDQRQRLSQHFGAARWAYNYCLQQRMQTYADSKKSLSCFTQTKNITALKKVPETSWLKDINAQTLEAAVHNLDQAYTRFFREKKGFPRFKSKYGKQSCAFRQGNSVDFDVCRLVVSKFREGIRYRDPRTFTGTVKTVTVSRTATGKYFAAVLVEETVPDVKQAPLKLAKGIGVDLGIKTFAVYSDGDTVATPAYLRAAEARLRRQQRRLSRCKKGSANRAKQRMRVARVHEKVSNQRKNFLHTESRKLVDKNHATTFCFETLNVRGMVKNHHLAKSISDAGWYTFRQYVTYKAGWAGKNVLEVGRFFPSSKLCGHCGHINDLLTLKDRSWTCPQCRTEHDRDLNAAKNIRNIAFADKNLLWRRTPEATPAESIR